MKKILRIFALLLVLSLLLCGCGEKKSELQAEMDSFLQDAETALAQGEFLFVGKVLGKVTEDRLITYYDADMGENTFYSVEVTEDLYGCMPDRTITVGILGNSETFPDRTPLSKGKEYYFQTYLWVEGDQIIFLLPTFYTALAEREAGMIYATINGERHFCGSEEEYREALKQAEERAEYGPMAVWKTAEASFGAAYGRSTAAYFEKLEISVKDPETLEKTEETAYKLLQEIKKTEKSWEGLGDLLQ